MIRPAEADMRFANKRRSARLLVLMRALRGGFGNYHAIKRTDPHSEMTELRLFRSIPL